MILDSSAVIAILRDEPDAEQITRAMKSAHFRRMSAASFVEVANVIDSDRDAVASRRVDEIVREIGIKIEPVTERQARIAREAYRDFGRGSGHRARLNYGDCFAYALAKDLNEPLLFKGSDFTHTDIKSVLDGF